MAEGKGEPLANDRYKLLSSAYTNEMLRRMARRAGVASVSESGNRPVNPFMRVIADLILRNLADKISVLLDHRETATISEAVLRDARP